MVWQRLSSRPPTTNRCGPLLTAGAVFHSSGAELYSRSSPELAWGLPDSPEYKGTQKSRSPAGVTLRPPRTKKLFGAPAERPASIYRVRLTGLSFGQN